MSLKHHRYLVPLSAYIIIVVLLPLIYLAIYSLHVNLTAPFLSVLESAVKQSLLQATVSTLISLPLGLLFGIMLVIYNGRWRNVIIALMLITYVMPGLIMSIGIVTLFGYSSRFAEIIYGNVVYNAPLIAVLAFSTGSTTNMREVNSARILGAKETEIIRRFYFRNSLRGGLLGGILAFVLAFEGFSLPLIIGGPAYSTMEVMIYEFKNVIPALSQFPFSPGAFIAVLQIVTLVFPLYIYLSVRGYSRRTESSVESPLHKYNSLSLISLIVFLVFVLLPLFSVFVKYPLWVIDINAISSRLTTSLYSVIFNTLFFAFSSTFIAFLVSVFIAVYRISFRNQFLVLLPLIFSPVSLALSYYILYGQIMPMSVVIIFIFTVTLIPLNLRMITQAVETLPESELSSSRTLGDSKFSSFFKIQLPRLRWELSTIVSLMFITVMGEFSSIITVYTSSTETLTVGIYRLLMLRDLKGTYGLTELFLIAIFISSFAINYLGKSGTVEQA